MTTGVLWATAAFWVDRHLPRTRTVPSERRVNCCPAPLSQAATTTTVPSAVFAEGDARQSFPPVVVVTPETSGVRVGACSSGGRPVVWSTVSG